jgi:hypothetical protein
MLGYLKNKLFNHHNNYNHYNNIIFIKPYIYKKTDIINTFKFSNSDNIYIDILKDMSKDMLKDMSEDIFEDKTKEYINNDLYYESGLNAR